MTRSTAIILLAAAALFVVGVLLNRSAPAPLPAQTASLPLPEKAGEPIKVPAAMEWNSVSQEELRAVSDHFSGDAATGRKFDLDMTVAPGESIVTDAYEARPGEFIISQMTPTLTTGADGVEMVEVSAKTWGLMMSGDNEVIGTSVLQIPPRTTAARLVVSDDGTYALAVSAVIESPSAIRLKVGADFEAK